MKTKSMMLVAAMLFIGMTSLFAKDGKTEEINVYGNCSMCKARIEKAAKSVEGVTKATWDATEKMMKVTYDDTKTTALKIEEAIAKVGHDTDHAKADDSVYAKLPGCCKYDRPVSEKK